MSILELERENKVDGFQCGMHTGTDGGAEPPAVDAAGRLKKLYMYHHACRAAHPGVIDPAGGHHFGVRCKG